MAVSIRPGDRLLPTFGFPIWLAGLVIGVLLLLGMSPLVFRGSTFLLLVSYVLGILMTGNAPGHIGESGR